MRPIDANKLLKKCIEGDGSDEFTDGYNFAVREISEYITLAPTVEPEVQHGRWIPCSERMPERGEEVLVWFEHFRYGEYNRLYQTYGIGQYFGKYDDRESWLIDHETGWRDLKVYAWVSMPDAYEPPKE